MFRKIRISAVALLISGVLAAQSSGIKIHLFDKVSGQALPFGNVVVQQGDKEVAGATTDNDGYAEIKPLDPGTYNVRAVYEGHHDYVIEGVIVSQDQLAHIEAAMVGIADTTFHVTVMRYRNPLISKGTVTGGVADSSDIHHMAVAGNINAVVANIPGVYSKDVGGDLNIRGGRSDATQYIIDGQKVTADQGLGGIPSSMIDQISVITGGTPAKYGDATGGIVEVNTLSGADHFFGSVQGLTSNLFDQFHYNDANFSVGGPIWSKKDSNHNKRPILDFVFGGEYSYTRDQNPSFEGTYFVDPATLSAIEAQPLTLGTSGGFTRSAEYITANEIDNQSWHQNNAQDILQLSGKLNYHLSESVKITVGGSYEFQTGHDWNNYYVYQMFNSGNDPLDQTTDYKGFIRLTQKFYTPEGKDKSALIKNAFYSIQAEYSHHFNKVDNGNFGDNIFDYGYVGQFYQYRTPHYTFKDGSQGYGRYMDS
ncbi:MAG TPA: TonB-dependent receptor, partial [Bacteroidia bacterium]|nr:TonB-dependent receptor [Bacteroidia bacterium]